MRRPLQACVAAQLALVAGLATAETLAPGPGADLVAKSCTKCHALDNVVAVRKGRSDWDSTVHLMVNYGLEMSDEDLNTVLNYLSAYYGLQPRPKK